MMSGDGYVVGIDAGGTTMRIAVADVRGQAVAEGSGPAGNDGARVVAEVLAGTLARLPERPVLAVCAGVARITREAVRSDWERVLRERFPNAVIDLVPDYVIAFHGATDGIGVAVIAGTGSVAYGENGVGGAERVGGRGWEWGDEGSGGWLTTEILRRTMRSLDGLAPVTPMTEAVTRALGTSEPAILGEEARRRIAAEGRGFLVPIALEWARGGDIDARNLFAGASGWLALLGRVAARRLGMEHDAFDLATVGGMWEAGDLIREPFETVVARWMPAARIVAAHRSPVQGAVARALRRTGPQRR